VGKLALNLSFENSTLFPVSPVVFELCIAPLGKIKQNFKKIEEEVPAAVGTSRSLTDFTVDSAGAGF
jgi:hypothetical protein